MFYRCQDQSVFSVTGKDNFYTYIQYWNMEGKIIHNGRLPGDLLADKEIMNSVISCNSLEEAFYNFPVAKSHDEMLELIKSLPSNSVVLVASETLKELGEIAASRRGLTLKFQVSTKGWKK